VPLMVSVSVVKRPQSLRLVEPESRNADTYPFCFGFVMRILLKECDSHSSNQIAISDLSACVFRDRLAAVFVEYCLNFLVSM